MDAGQFDDALRRLGVHRRSALVLLMGGALGLPANARANEKKKDKGKKDKKKDKKRGCSEGYQVAGQNGKCMAHPDLGKCSDEEEHEEGHKLAGQCRDTYNGYCDQIPEANECKAYFFNCCKYRETCERDVLTECITFGFNTVYPELCHYVRLPGACP